MRRALCSLNRFLQSLTGGPRTRRRPSRCLPGVEALEGRVVPSGANFQLQFQESGLAPLVISDNGPGDQNPAPGNIHFAGTYGDFTIDLAILTSDSSSFPTNKAAKLDLTLSNLAITNNDPGADRVLTLAVTDTDFVFAPGATLTLHSSSSSTVAAPNGPTTLTWQAFADPGNAAFAQTFAGTPITMAYSAGVGQSSASGNQADAGFTAGSDGKFSLTGVLTADLTGGATVVGCGGQVDILPPPTASIAITPQNAVNEISHAEPVTITVTAIPNGSGTPTFGTPTLTLAGGSGATLGAVSAPTFSDNGNVATYTTMIDSAAPGTFTITASDTVTMGSTTVTPTTGDGISGDSAPAQATFEDAYLTIGPSTTAVAGQSQTVTVSVFESAGTGYIPATNVSVMVTLTGSNGATIQTVSQSPRTRPLATGSINLTTNASGQATVTFTSTTAGTVTANATAGVTLNGLTLTRATGDGLSQDSGAAVDTFTAPLADVDITMTADQATVNAGQTAGFTITLLNEGAGAATGLTLSDALPGGLGKDINWQIDASTGSPTAFSISGVVGKQVLTLDPSVTTLAAGSSLTVHITGVTTKRDVSGQNHGRNHEGDDDWGWGDEYDGDADDCLPVTGPGKGAGARLVNTATVNAANEATGDQNAQASATITINGVQTAPRVIVFETPDQSLITAGQPAGFTIQVVNRGGAAATGLTLTDALPAGLGNDINWQIDTSTGNPTAFSISGTVGSQMLTFSPATTTLAAGASLSIHITGVTSSLDANGPNPEPLGWQGGGKLQQNRHAAVPAIVSGSWGQNGCSAWGGGNFCGFATLINTVTVSAANEPRGRQNATASAMITIESSTQEYFQGCGEIPVLSDNPDPRLIGYVFAERGQDR